MTIVAEADVVDVHPCTSGVMGWKVISTRTQTTSLAGVRSAAGHALFVQFAGGVVPTGWQ
jgi:hypothetical protein